MFHVGTRIGAALNAMILLDTATHVLMDIVSISNMVIATIEEDSHNQWIIVITK